MLKRIIESLVMVGTLVVSASTLAHPIFCDRFENESCLELPRISLEAPDFVTFESGSLLITLEKGAPPGGQDVLLFSSDPTILELPGSVTFSEFQDELTIPISTDVDHGNVTLEATALNHQPAAIEISVSPRSLQFEFVPLIGIGHSVEGEVALDRGAPEGGTTVLLSSSDASVVTISPSQVIIAEGETAAPITISALQAGSVELNASAAGYELGAATVSSSNDIVSIGNIPELIPGETRGLPISLLQPAPPGGLTVLLETTDPDIATVDALVEFPEGSRVPGANAQVTGITTGDTAVVARRDGFATISRAVTVRKLQLGFSPDPLQIPVGWTMEVSATLPTSAPAGGVAIALTSSDDSIIAAPDSIIIPAGQTTAVVEITALNEGTASLLAQGEEIETAELEINVGELPTISLEDLAVGKNLQEGHRVSLDRVPPQAVDITLTVADPSIALLTSQYTYSDVGTASISLNNVLTAYRQYFLVQGLNQGSTTLTASAAGFNDAQATLTVTKSGFYIDYPERITRSTISNPAAIVIEPARLNADGSWSEDQSIRPGLSVQLPVISADPNIGEITNSPIVVEGGTSSGRVARFNPKAVGSTTVTLNQAAGFFAPTDRPTSIEADVFLPHAIEDVAVGEGLQVLHGPLPLWGWTFSANVTISVADPSIALVSTDGTTVGTASLMLPGHPNGSSPTFYVQGLSQGTTTMTASAVGFNDVHGTITVTESGFAVANPNSISTTTVSSPTNISIKAIQLYADGSSTGFQDVRPGLTVEVPVTSSDPSVGEITVSPVVIEGGPYSSGSTAFEPHTVGTTTLSVSQPEGFYEPPGVDLSIDAEVTNPGISLTNFEVGRNLQGEHRVRLKTSPADPVDLVVSVADPAIALITRQSASVGTDSITFNNVSNAQFRDFLVQGLTQGATMITASAAGFDDISAIITVTDSGFYISAPDALSISPYSSPDDIFIRAVRLDATGSLAQWQEVRPGLTVEVPVASADPGVGQITTSPVVFGGGAGSLRTTQFDPVNVGSTTISITRPPDFTAPIDGTQTIEVDVGAPMISLEGFSIGQGLQDEHFVRLSQPLPDPVDLVLTVADPSVAIISPERQMVGMATITFDNLSDSSYQRFFVQGISQGSTLVTASAPGFNDIQTTLTVTPSGFAFDYYGPVSTTTVSAPSTLIMRSLQLNASGAFLGPQELRHGLTVEVPVTSANPGIGQILTSPVVFEGGIQDYQVTQFSPQTIGTTTVSMTQPTGYSVPAHGAQDIDIEVRTPGIRLLDFMVGKNLQGEHSVSLSPTPDEPVNLLLSVTNPAIAVVSSERTALGSASMTISGFDSYNNQTFHVQGLSQGVTTLTASAPGFTPIQASLTVTDSGFFIASPSSILTTHFSDPTDITISAGPIGANGASPISQEIRAGLTIQVPVTIANSAIGQLSSSPMVFQGGTGADRTTQFDPGSRGTTTVAITQPAGFNSPNNRNRSIPVEVTASDLIINHFTVGDDLQDRHSVRLSLAPPTPVDLALIVADPSIARISRDQDIAGSTAIILDDISTTNSQYFYVHGLAQGSTTIRASAAGFFDTEAILTVTDSGFYIDSPSSISTTILSNPSHLSIRAARLNANGTFAKDLEVRAGLTVEVPVTSADPDIGLITTSPVVFEGATGYSKSTQFDPGSVGSTVISMSQPGGFTTPTNRNHSIDAEVRAPGFIFDDFSVGRDLQGEHDLRLSVSPPEPVDIVLTVADPATALIARDRTTPGTASITLTGIDNTWTEEFWVQGISPGTTTITASATGFEETQATLTITESGFYISTSSLISTTTLSSPLSIGIQASRLDAAGSASGIQEVRAGLSVEVPVISADPEVGEIVTNPLVIEGGTGTYQSTAFDPAGVGTTTVSIIQPNGFNIPTNRNQSIEIEVSLPDIELGNFFVGENLQGQHYVNLGVSPPDPVNIVLSISDPAIALIASSSTEVGTPSLTLDSVGNSFGRTFILQGLSEGSTTLTASATGFESAQADLVVTESGFHIYWPSSISTTTLSDPTSIGIQSARLDTGGIGPTAQSIRAGLTIEVPVASSNPGVGHITASPLVFEGGAGASQSTQFTPNALGTSTVSVSQPTGFIELPDRNQSIDAQVRPPFISLPSDFSMSEGQVFRPRVSLEVAPQSPVDITLTVANPLVVLLAPDQTAPGTPSLTIENVSSTFSEFFYVQGIGQGVTTITASAPGFANAQTTITVTSSSTSASDR